MQRPSSAVATAVGMEKASMMEAAVSLMINRRFSSGRGWRAKEASSFDEDRVEFFIHFIFVSVVIVGCSCSGRRGRLLLFVFSGCSCCDCCGRRIDDFCKSLDAQVLGRLEQSGELSVLDRHLTFVHELNERLELFKFRVFEDDDGVTLISMLNKERAEETRTSREDHFMSAHRAALG